MQLGRQHVRALTGRLMYTVLQRGIHENERPHQTAKCPSAPNISSVGSLVAVASARPVPLGHSEQSFKLNLYLRVRFEQRWRHIAERAHFLDGRTQCNTAFHRRRILIQDTRVCPTSLKTESSLTTYSRTAESVPSTSAGRLGQTKRASVLFRTTVARRRSGNDGIRECAQCCRST
jgi:hypothetical protein